MGPSIFLSSPHKGLGEARDLADLVARAVRLRQYKETKVVRTETEGPAPLPPLAECLRRVREANLVILLLGYRYGSPILDDPKGRSYTEAEFDEAITHNKKLLVFVANKKSFFRRKDVDIPSTKIDAFRERVEAMQETGGYMLHYFASLNDFEGALARALDAHLRTAVAATPICVQAPAENISLPYMCSPPFDGMDGQKLYGRDTELSKLDQWLEDSDCSAMMVRAIGGMGKSSLAWCWLDQVDERNQEPLIAGKFWFSFYISDHSIRHFARALRDWLEPHVPPEQRLADISPDTDWAAIKRYLQCFKRKPLLVLDGLEAEFFGYIGRQRHMPNTDVSLGGKFGAASGTEETDPEDGVIDKFAEFRDRAGGEALVDFIRTGLAKILITTREIPNTFVQVSHGERSLICGMEEFELKELSPESARKLLSEFKVTATNETLDALLKSPVIRHPLILTVFANHVSNDDFTAGNLDNYIARYPEQRILDFAKRLGSRHHVLKFVFDDLTSIEESAIGIITVSDVAMPSELVISAVEKKGYPPSAIQDALNNLKFKRGLVHAARRKAVDRKGEEVIYSMHPVCRMYWTKANLQTLRESAESIDEEFEAHLFGGVGRGITSPSVFDLETRVLPVTRVALDAARYERAWGLSIPFRNSYEKYGLYGDYVELLKDFLVFRKTSDGLSVDTPVKSRNAASSILRAAANALRLFDENTKAIACAQALVDLVTVEAEDKTDRSEGGGEVDEVAVGLEEAELSLILARVKTQTMEQNWRDLFAFWEKLSSKDVIKGGDHIIATLFAESVRLFGVGNRDQSIPFSEFLISVRGVGQNYTSLNWSIVPRFKHITSSTVWTIENITENLNSLFASADPRNNRLATLSLISELLKRNQTKKARDLHDHLSTLEGWAQLDLDRDLQWLDICVMLKCAEQADHDTQINHAEIRSAIDTYEAHHNPRFTEYDELSIAIVRLRYCILTKSSDAEGYLEIAVDSCQRLKLAQGDARTEQIIRCAEDLGHNDVVASINKNLPVKYDMIWALPDPIYQFLPDPNRTEARPWVVEEG